MSIPVCIVGSHVASATPVVISDKSDAIEVTIVGLNFKNVNLVYIVPQGTPGATPIRLVGASRLVDGTLTTPSSPAGSGTALVLEGTLTAIVLEGTLTALITE